MSNVINIGASGLDAAVKRLSAAANNVANASTPGYKPVEAVSKPAGLTGGVQTDFAVRAGASEVDLSSEAVDMNMAVTSYKANAAVIRAQDDMQRELLNDFRV